MFKYLNKGISAPIALIIILILAASVGGFTLWQYSEIQKEQIELMSLENEEQTTDFKETAQNLFSDHLDKYKDTDVSLDSRIKSYTINSINIDMIEDDCFGFTVNFSVDTLKDQNNNWTNWIAGNGKVEGNWVKNKTNAVDVVKENGNYKIREMGTSRGSASCMGKNDGIALLLGKIEKETNIDFSEMKNIKINWATDLNKIIIVEGKGIEKEDISQEERTKINSFLKNEGFEIDGLNSGDGTLKGAMAYKKEDIFCIWNVSQIETDYFACGKLEEPYIKVLSPNGGEEWNIGNTYTIKWNSNGVEKIDIGYKKEGSGVDINGWIGEEVSASLGEYSWNIPNIFSPENNKGWFYIIIAEHPYLAGGVMIEDRSDNYFTIVKNETVEVSIWPDVKSFNLENKTFEGKKWFTGETVKILTNESTKFYRGASNGIESFVVDKYYTFSEFQSLLKEWTGPEWRFTVRGVLENDGTIKASEVFFITQ